MNRKVRNVRLFGTALLACLFGTACQDDIAPVDNSGQQDLVQTAEGYVKVNINLPVTTGVGTRATSYSNDTADEYQVNDAIIVFFEGTDETSATFKKAYSLSNLTWNDAEDEGSQVTTTSRPYVTEAPKATEGNKIYALMVLNANSVLSVSDGKLMQGSNNVFATDTKVSALQGTLADQDVNSYISKSTGASSTSSFFMSSAPLSNIGSDDTTFPTNASASILTQVNVYDTKTEAEAPGNAADQLYVERIVAKVSMDVKDDIVNSDQTPSQTGTTIVNIGSEAYDGDYVELQGWVLNVTNKSTKLVRDVEDFSTWMGYTSSNQNKRFVESAAVKTGAQKFRINWAIDGNYDGSGYSAATAFNTWSDTNQPTAWETKFTDNGDVAYCFENTSDVTNMNQDQTTSVLIKGKYTRVTESEDENGFFIVGEQAGALIESQFIDLIKAEVPAVAEKTITINPNAVGGYYNVSDKTDRLLSNLLTVTDYSGTDLSSVVASIGTVKYYKNNETYYYTTLIRHFDENETPLVGDEEYSAAKHLGRYGVVRNTWYQMTINSISGPGEPEIPEPEPEPDDKHEGYIKMEVNILAWAVRNNGVDL